MKINRLFLISLVVSTLCVGCDSNNNSSSSNKDTIQKTVKIEINNSTKNENVITPENVTIKNTKHSMESKMLHNLQYLPSIGDINMLVIPVLLPDYQEIHLDNDGIDDKNKVKEDIEKAFFSDNLGNYESVKTFYQKSSYGKLNLNGTVTDWFDVSKHTSYPSAVAIDYYDTYDLVRTAINWVKLTLKLDLTKYDNDKDGYIDGVWFVYSCPNYRNGGPQTNYGNYWAYTSWGNQNNDIERPNINNPIYNLFGWASYDFMYENGINNIDARTYIHETGHFLGLNDYYSDLMFYNPIGKIDMMDANIIDHNSYSKMLLGWTKPYIVRGNTTINLKSMHNENSLIVIPSDNTIIENNEFDPFSEYILIEYYTSENLNYDDSQNKYSNGLIAPKEDGVRIYHIDNRPFIVNSIDRNNIIVKEYKNETIDKYNKLILPITNHRGYDNYNDIFNLDPTINLYDEIRLIEATNIDTFSNGGIQNNKSFFKTNDIFSIEKYGKNFFINNNKFNNGDSFSYQVTIKEVI